MPGIRFPVVVSGVPVVTAPEEVDISNAGQLTTALLRAVAGWPATAVVVDMTRTRFCDSAGLMALTRAHRQALAGGGELRLVIPAGSVVARLCAITGLDRVIALFGDLEEALVPRPPAGRFAAAGMDCRGAGSEGGETYPSGRGDYNQASAAARQGDRR